MVVKALMGLVTALSIPLMLLNLLGAIASGIWLAVLRDWGMIGLGIGFFFTSTFVLGFALMPSLLLAAPGLYFAERGKTIGLVFFIALSSLYTLGLITIWCCGVLFLFVRGASTADLIPRLIWSYGVATGPWAYMASKEQDPGLGSTLPVFLAQLAYLIIIVLVIFFPVSLLGALKVFGGFMLVSFVVQINAVILLQRERVAQKHVLEE